MQSFVIRQPAASCHWGTCPPDSMATVFNSLQNRVKIETGKIVLVDNVHSD